MADSTFDLRLTRREAVARAAGVLSAAGITPAEPEAEWLLAEVLGCTRPALWLNAAKELSPAEHQRFEQWLERRSTRMPLQHITGRAMFLDWELRVTPAVLIPRPETEGLALRASTLLSAGSGSNQAMKPRVLDFATGSGCLALALAARHPQAEVHALDISPSALAVARENAHQLGLAQRVMFHCGDGFAALPKMLNPAFDLIVSNPPYIPTSDLLTLEPEVRDHDPRLALDGGADGLDFYRRLAQEASAWLRPGGWLALEFGDGQAGALTALFSTAAWENVQIEPDLSGRPRILIACRV